MNKLQGTTINVRVQLLENIDLLTNKFATDNKIDKESLSLFVSKIEGIYEFVCLLKKDNSDAQLQNIVDLFEEAYQEDLLEKNI